MQYTVIDRIVPHHMRRANDIVRTFMQYFGRPGRTGCRDAAAGVFGNDSWHDLQLACIDQHRPHRPTRNARTWAAASERKHAFFTRALARRSK